MYLYLITIYSGRPSHDLSLLQLLCEMVRHLMVAIPPPPRRRASLFNYMQLLWIMWSCFFLQGSLVCPYPNRNPLMLMSCNGSEAAKANCRSANKRRLIRPTTVPHLQTLPSKTLSWALFFPWLHSLEKKLGCLQKSWAAEEDTISLPYSSPMWTPL